MSWLTGLINRLTGKPAAAVAKSEPVRLEQSLRSSGRVNYELLAQYAHDHPEKIFVRYVRQPVLVGSGLFQGMMSSRAGNKTMMFTPKVRTGQSGPDHSEQLERAIYPLVKKKGSTSPLRLFTVGRTDENDMVMPDYTISGRHAEIRIAPDEGYFLRDVGSTNGTLVNDQRVGMEEVALENLDVIKFGRFQFTFLTPRQFYLQLTEQEGATDAPEELQRLASS